MKIKDCVKYSERLVNDYNLIKRKLTKLSYLLDEEERINLIDCLEQLNNLILDINQRLMNKLY